MIRKILCATDGEPHSEVHTGRRRPGGPQLLWSGEKWKDVVGKAAAIAQAAGFADVIEAVRCGIVHMTAAGFRPRAWMASTALFATTVSAGPRSMLRRSIR